MTLREFTQHLETAGDRELRFVLPDCGVIEPHAHITEVGRVDKAFVDCGGTVRRTSHISLQTWVADDLHHRLAPAKLAAVIEKAAPILGTDDLEVEIEHEDGLISQFPVHGADRTDEHLVFYLGSKHTDCLAKELCVPAAPGASQDACCSGGGCC
jgi:hypothetical protein